MDGMGGGGGEGAGGREGRCPSSAPAVLSVLNLGTLYTRIPNNADTVEPLCYIVYS